MGNRNKTDEKLIKAAIELLIAMDKAADKYLAEEIAGVVKLHAKLAVGSAWIPVSGLDVAAGAANIWSMYVRINKKIGLPFGENVVKSIGSGVATNLAGYITMSAAGSALKWIPGIGTIGGAVVMSASLYAITMASGWVYLKALCKLAGQKGRNINACDLNGAVNDVLKNKSTIKEFIDSAKESYKK